MSSILSANLKALAARQPSLAVRDIDRTFTCVAGVWRFADGAQSIAVHGREPDREADAIVDDALADHQAARVLAVIGLGAGFVLDALERRGWDGRVLAFEPAPETLPGLLGRREWGRWLESDRLRILLGPDYAGTHASRGWFEGVEGDPPFIVNPALARLRPAAVETARTALSRLMFDVRANADARKRHAGRYLLNTLGNLRTIAREGDVADLRDAARDVPAVVVGAGPSLDLALQGLQRANDRAIVIAVDTALRPLLAAGVSPQLVVALDPADANARHLSELPPCEDTFLAAEASLAPAALTAFEGRTFLFSVSDHQPWPWLAGHRHARGRVRAWGSVLTSAFDIAVQLGCNPIAFAGADLAFTGDRPYARGVVYEEDWRRLYEWGVALDDQWRQQVDAWPRVDEPDIHGVPTRTASHLVAFRNWLAEQTKADQRRTYFNATGAGILHGPALRQASIDDLVAGWPRLERNPIAAIRQRYQPREGRKLLEAADALAQELKADPGQVPVMRDWSAFAEDVTAERVVAALRRASSDGVAAGPVDERSAKASPWLDTYWIAPLAANLALVRWPIPAVRLDAHAPGVRRFRTRSSVARLVACMLVMPDGAVAEDGTALRRAESLETLQAGEYFLWRDEVYLRSGDGSDPALNGRTYTLLMPACVAAIESLPPDQIQRQRL